MILIAIIVGVTLFLGSTYYFFIIKPKQLIAFYKTQF
jgi:hypothetical protein